MVNKGTRGKGERPKHLNWKGDLQGLIDQKNGQHARRRKVVGNNTQHQRACGLFRAFKLLHDAGFRIAPDNFRGSHVAFLMRFWTADPCVPAELAKRNGRATPLSAPLSPAYIQQQLSFVRTFAAWIGKDGMVRPAECYVSDPALVKRASAADRDRSWGAAGVDVEAVLERVYACDAVVGLQLELIMAFGLRRQEAIMFSPTLAEVPAHALPASAGATRHVAFLRIKRGTKGGRLRYTAIRNAAQEQALARAHAYVQSFGPKPASHVGRPGMSLKQSLDRFSYVMRVCGITKAQLGVTGHGMRHQFAADLFFELTGVKPPVAGGAPGTDPATMEAAYLEVAHQLGHGRPQIAGAYLGARRRSNGNDLGPGNEGAPVPEVARLALRAGKWLGQRRPRPSKGGRVPALWLGNKNNKKQPR